MIQTIQIYERKFKRHALTIISLEFILKLGQYKIWKNKNMKCRRQQKLTVWQDFVEGRTKEQVKKLILHTSPSAASIPAGKHCLDSQAYRKLQVKHLSENLGTEKYDLRLSKPVFSSVFCSLKALSYKALKFLMGQKHLTLETNNSSAPNIEIPEYLCLFPMTDFICQLQCAYKQEQATATKHLKDGDPNI